MENQEHLSDQPTLDAMGEEEILSMEELLEQETIDFTLPKRGEVRTGTIASVNENEILVSVGAKSEGVIPLNDLDGLSQEEREALVEGAEIPVYVVSTHDRNGELLLSYKRALEEKDWKLVEELLESGEVYESKIHGYNKGGLIVKIGSLRGFVPASQVSVLRRLEAEGDTPDQRWGKMVGEPITVKVLEVDRRRRRLILSERAALNESRDEIRRKILENLHEGDVLSGRVTSIADFGAFVTLKGGADGLVHLSEISWEHIDHPSEVLKEGQEVTVQVISVDVERKRVGLSIRRLQPDPWYDKIASFRKGQLVEATITRLAKFGAFARLENGVEGLIHISEISDQHIEHPREVLHEGEKLVLRVIKVDPENRRIGLSLKKVDSPAYADLDMKMALEEAADLLQGSEDREAPPEEEDAPSPDQAAE